VIDSSLFRDMLLDLGGLEAILQITRTKTKAIMDRGIWAISHMVKKRPVPPFDRAKIAISALASIFQKETDPNVLSDIASILYNFPNEIQYIIDLGVVPALVNHLKYLLMIIILINF